ncbi:MAG: 2-hydroxychromene-2-carboxylate isomerase [Oxalobacteraceae bacterium]|nr:MAG: 2-hydroxychromene-2-carboxylate isomerase [Oxalobacteraceae bacterium]
MSKACTYYLAPPSPYVYLGHQRFAALVKEHAVDVDVRPFDLGRVFGTSGGLPLAKRAPQRQAYRLVELERWSRFLGLPLNLHPAFFPVAGDPAARLIIAAKLAGGNDAAMRLTGAIGRAVWVEERDIASADTLSAIAAESGLDSAALVESAGSAAVQAEYDRYTEDAIAANVFGAPWYIVDGVGYWGQDRLDFVERAFQQK